MEPSTQTNESLLNTPSFSSPVKANQTSTTPPRSRFVLIGLALILLGILIGVLAARFLPMSTTQETPKPELTTPTIEVSPASAETVTIPATQSGVTEEPSVKLRTEVENWSSYVKSLTKFSWDSCDKEPSNSSDLKMTMATVPVSTKEINGVKLAITPKISFTSSDIAEFVLCEAGAYRPIYVSGEYILWISPCSTGMEPDNSLCTDSFSKIEKLYQ